MYRSKVRCVSLAAIVAAILAVLLFPAGKAPAQTETKVDYLAFGMIGLCTGQTARLNVVSVGMAREFPVELVFLDAAGNVLARSVERAIPGRAVWVDLPFVPGGHGHRLPLRALVRWPHQVNREGYVIPSIEIIDDVSGRTTIVVGNPEG